MRQAGSITKKRKRWYIVYRTPAGKQKWEGGFETKGQAQVRLIEALGQMQNGSYFEPSETTFADFADQWLDNRINIGGSTWAGYRSYLKRYAKPELGTMRLRDIRHVHIQGLISRLASEKGECNRRLSANSVCKIATMLVTIFKSAVTNNLIRTNPAAELELPTVIKVKIEPPGKEDVLAILRQAPVEHQTIFLLDAVTGLRRGEILALKWKDLDWISGEVLIERAIKRVRATDGVHRYGWAIGSTKSGRERRVGIPPLALQSLETLRSAVDFPEGDQFIFTRNGTFINPAYFSKWIALPLIRKATGGRVRRFHDLRHFFASVLIENGESPKYIQDQVGHASITMTYDTYGHLFPQARQQATKKLERSIFGKNPNVRRLLEHLPKKAIPETVN